MLDEAGTGPIDAFVRGLCRQTGMNVSVEAYSEHAVGRGADAEAVAYVALRAGAERFWGVGRHASIVRASLDALCAALNRMPDATGLCRALAAE